MRTLYGSRHLQVYVALCESKLYAKEDGAMKQLMEGVIRVFSADGALVAVDIAGRELKLESYVVVEVDALAHRIVVESVRH